MSDNIFNVLAILVLVLMLGVMGALDDETSDLNLWLRNLTPSNGDSQ